MAPFLARGVNLPGEICSLAVLSDSVVASGLSASLATCSFAVGSLLYPYSSQKEHAFHQT